VRNLITYRNGIRLRQAAALAWMAVIFAFSSMPGSDVPSRYGTLAHFVEYAILGALLVGVFRDHKPSGAAAAWSTIAASAYAVTDELHQAFVPGRVPDVSDWGVDTLGAFVGALVMTLLISAASEGLTRRGKSQP
jgi:VanZ family protein